MNTVELKLTLSFSSCVFDVLLTSDFLENSFTADPHTHGHPFFEFQYVEQGTCRLQWDHCELLCPAGTVLLIPPHTEHILLPEEGHTVTGAFFYQPKSDANAAGFASLFSASTPVSFLDVHGLLHGNLCNIRQELKQRSPFFWEKVRGELTLLFANVVSQIAPNTEEQQQAHGENRAQAIENYIASHCFDPNASMAELAASLHLSPRQLHRQCLAFFGAKINQMVLLRSTDGGKTFTHSIFAEDTPPCQYGESWLVRVSDDLYMVGTWQTAVTKDTNRFFLSRDGMKSFTGPYLCPFHGQSSALEPIGDGKVLMVYNYRSVDPAGVYLALAKPDETGFHMIANEPVCESVRKTYNNTGGEFNEWTDFAFGEPSVTLLPDDTILVTLWYDEGTKKGIRYVKLKMQQ